MLIAVQMVKRLSIDIDRLVFLLNAPACNRVVVIDTSHTALGDERRARRLHHAGRIGRAALQSGGASSPLRWRSELRLAASRIIKHQQQR
jgi:hypothetical protein